MKTGGLSLILNYEHGQSQKSPSKTTFQTETIAFKQINIKRIYTASKIVKEWENFLG